MAKFDTVAPLITSTPGHAMNWADYLLSFLKLSVDLIVGVAWPAVVLLIVWIFRDHLGALWDRLTALEAGGVKATFDRGLAKAELVVEEAKLAEGQSEQPGPQISAQPPSGVYADRIMQLAELSPISAIVTKWLEVDDAMRRLARDRAIDPRLGPIGIMKRLKNQKIISEKTYESLRLLRDLRTIAQHSDKSGTITVEEAQRFTELADSIVGILSNSR
jgi:hypothetical protein